VGVVVVVVRGPRHGRELNRRVAPGARYAAAPAAEAARPAGRVVPAVAHALNAVGAGNAVGARCGLGKGLLELADSGKDLA